MIMMMVVLRSGCLYCPPWVEVIPWSCNPGLQVEIVTLKVMGGGASGRSLGREGRAFGNRISVYASLE